MQAKIGHYIGRMKMNLLRNIMIIPVMQIGAYSNQEQATNTPVYKADVKLELPDNVGAMKTVSNMSDSNFALQEIGEVKSELSDNLGVGRIASDRHVLKPNQTKINKMNTQNSTTGTAAATTTAPEATKRSKANYDVVRGQVMVELTKKPGMTLNELFAVLGKGTATNLNFPVIYAAVGQLRKGDKPAVFGTGAKKNEGLYLSKEDAEKNKPAPRAVAASKGNQPHVLEKLISVGTKVEDDKWKVIEGNTEPGPIKSAYDAASMVPDTIFRIVDNSGAEPKIVESGKITKAMRKESVAEVPAEQEAATA